MFICNKQLRFFSNRHSSGKGYSNSKLENDLNRNKRRHSDPAGSAISQNGKNKLDFDNGMGENIEGHLPRIKDARNLQKGEKIAGGKKKREAAAKVTDGAETALKKLVPMQNKSRSKEKDTKDKLQDRMNDGTDVKRKEYIKFELTKDRRERGLEHGTLDASNQSKQLAGFDTENAEQRQLASPTLPLSRNQSNSQNGMTRSSPGRKVGLPTPTSRGSMNSEMWFSDMRPSTDQSGDISNWLRGETDDTTQRARSSSLGSTISRKQLYNEIYCMEKLRLTRGHTFSFFSLHPSYQEENKLLRSGIKLAKILQFMPKAIKLPEKEDEETTKGPTAPRAENENVQNKTVELTQNNGDTD